jgi:endoglucanase
MVFKDVNRTYSDKLLFEAKAYYEFAIAYPGTHMKGGDIPGYGDMRLLYPSSSYIDELAWGAAWLYRASNDTRFLNLSRQYYMENQKSLGHGCGWAYSWDEKGPALHVLLSTIDSDTERRKYYDSRAVEYFNRYLPGPLRLIPHTPRGLAFPFHWGKGRYAGNTAFLSIMYSKYLEKRNAGSADFRTALYKYGKSQIDYILGISGRSLMSGFGSVYPQYLMHKSSYASILYLKGKTLASATDEMWTSTYPQIHIPYGAISGGPIMLSNNQATDYFIDYRLSYMISEPGLDYSAGIVPSIAVLAEDHDVTPIKDEDLDLAWNFRSPR